MTYQKPEVTKLDNAVSAIQHFGKPSAVAQDAITLAMNAATANAYEADE